MTDTAWDRLLDLVDHVAAAPDAPLGDVLEPVFAELCAAGITDGSIDRELHVPDVARWLVGLVLAHRVISDRSHVSDDGDLAVLRVIITRWLHPARPR